MTDWYTDELFDNSLCPSVKAEVSRLLCDTERFCSDKDEEMSKYGMGFYYKKILMELLLRIVTKE